MILTDAKRERIIAMKTDNLPEVFKGSTDLDSSKLNIIDMAMKISDKPLFVEFPCNFMKKKTQRCIVNFLRYEFKKSPDCKVIDRYLDIDAYSLGVTYLTRVIPEETRFTLRVPWRSFNNMLLRDSHVHLGKILTEIQNKNMGPPMFEVHFEKVDRCVYQLKYLAFIKYIENDNGKNVWSRHRILFIEDKYKAPDLGLVGDSYF